MILPRIPRRLATFESLEQRAVLSGVAFVARALPFQDDVLLGTSGLAMDVDGNGSSDIVYIFRESANSGDWGIGWLRNTDGKGRFAAPETLVSPGVGPLTMAAQDVDGDGDEDLVRVGWHSSWRKSVGWHENKDGRGALGTLRPIASQLVDDSFAVGDVDSDGDLDVLASGYLYRNNDGRFSKEPELIWPSNRDRGASTQVADLDGDGDLDLLTGGDRFCGPHWLENVDGKGEFVFREEFRGPTGVERPTIVVPTDMDGDGDLDVLAADSTFETRIEWYENLDGEGAFGDGQLIGIQSPEPYAFLVHDVDADGDVDILVDGIVDTWLENTINGFELINQGFPAREGIGLHVADFNGDGAADLLVESLDGVLWFENRLIADANGDNCVDFDDFVVLAAGFGLENDATWETGDFDNNRKVDFDDFVLLADHFGGTRSIVQDTASASSQSL